jgi:hypothetical protein
MLVISFTGRIKPHRLTYALESPCLRSWAVRLNACGLTGGTFWPIRGPGPSPETRLLNAGLRVGANLPDPAHDAIHGMLTEVYVPDCDSTIRWPSLLHSRLS